MQVFLSSGHLQNPQSSTKTAVKTTATPILLWLHRALKKDWQSRRDPHPFLSPGSRFKAAVRTWFYAERLFNVLCIDQQLVLATLVHAWIHRAQTDGMLMLLWTSIKAYELFMTTDGGIVGSRCGFSVNFSSVCTISHCSVILPEGSGPVLIPAWL